MCVPRKPDLTIAFLGLDGAGKSTLIRVLQHKSEYCTVSSFRRVTAFKRVAGKGNGAVVGILK